MKFAKKLFLSSIFLFSLIQNHFLEATVENTRIIKEIHEDRIILDDGSAWEIGAWYCSDLQDWKVGDPLHIFYHSFWINNIALENLNQKNTCWGTLAALPTSTDSIRHMEVYKDDSSSWDLLVLESGKACRRSEGYIFSHSWTSGDRVFVYDNTDSCVLFNLDKNEVQTDWEIVDLDTLTPNQKLPENKILKLEKRLSQSVIGQPDATNAVMMTLLNYYAGLNDPTKPVHVFLFLGPTGVGKTELAKVAATELNRALIRFDMSHFHEPHSLARLIGSPPGYVNHMEGGQLTNAILDYPKSVVLLDEIEKAAREVQKIFLPAFDDAYLTDSRLNKVSCQDVIFIMTSNLCAVEIADLFNEGLEPDEVLAKIEPKLISNLSPEFYNRVDPILFRPLSQEVIRKLVDKMLSEVSKNMLEKKGIRVAFDPSVYEYLYIHGFHPVLGARPLKRLIQKKINALISLSILSSPRQVGKKLMIAYNKETEEWTTYWAI